MKVGKLVCDHTLGRNGIVVDGAHVEIGDGSVHAAGDPIEWEWLVLYDDGKMMGADTNDLQVIE